MLGRSYILNLIAIICLFVYSCVNMPVTELTNNDDRINDTTPAVQTVNSTQLEGILVLFY
jgi:hypothetical protein